MGGGAWTFQNTIFRSSCSLDEHKFPSDAAEPRGIHAIPLRNLPQCSRHNCSSSSVFRWIGCLFARRAGSLGYWRGETFFSACCGRCWWSVARRPMMTFSRFGNEFPLSPRMASRRAHSSDWITPFRYMWRSRHRLFGAWAHVACRWTAWGFCRCCEKWVYRDEKTVWIRDTIVQMILILGTAQGRVSKWFPFDACSSSVGGAPGVVSPVVFCFFCRGVIEWAAAGKAGWSLWY